MISILLSLMGGCAREVDPDEDGVLSPEDLDDEQVDTDTDLDLGNIDMTIEVEEDEVDCSADYDLPDAPEGECITETLPCNGFVLGNNSGGSTNYNVADWEDAGCLGYGGVVEDDALDGPERVYVLEMDPDMYATVTLYPCSTLEVRSVNTDKVCPEHPNTCRLSQGTWGNQYLNSVAGGTQGTRYEIVVDGFDGATGNFKLEAECFSGR